MLLQDKTGIVFGVANKRSIAFAVARAAADQGARLILTYQNERVQSTVEKLAASLPNEATAVCCDVGSDQAMDECFAQIHEQTTEVDFAVHSIAYADRKELDGLFLETSREGYATAQIISSWSLTGLCQRLAPMMPEGGSIVTMSYMGAEKVVPHYNVMGPAKAALEASVRYLAYDLGPRGIRVNAISAGPVRTLAAAGVAGFSQILALMRERTPLKRNTEVDEVADATVFMVSNMSRGITGSTLHVDAGYHITSL